MYAELVCRSNFSFLRGTSHPEELIAAAAHDGLYGIALTDLDGLYGAVKAHLCAKELGIRFVLGSQITLTDAPPVVVYVQDPEGYTNLCRLISTSRLSNPKGEAGVPWRELAERSRGLTALLPEPGEGIAPLAEAFAGRFYVGVTRTFSAGDDARTLRAVELSKRLGVPLCAHNDVHTHARSRQPLQDVLTAIRLKTTVAKAGRQLFPNGERTVKGPAEMARLFQDMPEAVGRTQEIVDACRFSLDQLRYHFPEQDLPPGHTPDSWLREQTFRGLRVRYPSGVPEKVVRQVEHELELIGKLECAGYFLALEDIVRFARERNILCQGRGSAANSVVCYALQITAIDPVRMGLLFERFMSMERKEPPDIDVDFEHERREEVLQYVYEKHGRRPPTEWSDGQAPRAGMVCEVICYRGKLALREVGKALGLSLDQVDRLARGLEGFRDQGVTPEMLRATGLSPEDPRVRLTVDLASQMEGVPRHLSIHVGGFVITREPLVDIAPVENAAMKDRTVVQWDKDDLAALNILKVDLLALGMLTAISKCLQLIRKHRGVELTLATIPPEDPRVYDMLCEADAIGVFQVESRAQLNMLARLKPRTFYDLVIEIAIIRPGPIIGDMVHPFLRRREGLEPVTYPSEEVRGILEKTLGVPLFQEQAMKLAMVAAGFTPAEADQLRRILSHKRAEELLVPFHSKFVEGAVARGYPRDFAENTFRQFKGFANYGFPESHSASFALIAYASSWLKCYYPAEFAAALLNSQPMGFYAPHTLVDDARRHGVPVRGVDVSASEWDCTLEPADGTAPSGSAVGSWQSAVGSAGGAAPGLNGTPPDPGRFALRLGMRLVKGLREDTAHRIARGRGAGYASVADVARKSRVPRYELARLVLAGALGSLTSSRRDALWELQALGPLEEDDLFFGIPMDDARVILPQLGVAERVTTDYETTGLSIEKHPLELLRPQLDARRGLSAQGLLRAKEGRRVGVGGMVICRQRPPTAHGFTFLSLEDETGISNLVVDPKLFDRYRKEVVSSIFLWAEGVLERSGKVVNVKVKHLEPLLVGERVPAPRRPVPLGHR
ncbi:MAG: error-prone DNA polymerase [Myxococcaceae bacterium]